MVEKNILQNKNTYKTKKAKMVMFNKIDSIIKKDNIKASQCVYHTLRTLENGGKIRVLVLQDNIAKVEYICVKCGFYGFLEAGWKRPFSIKCGKCSATIKLPKLKGKK